MRTQDGNSLDKLRHPRSVAYLAEQVLLNKQRIWCGGAYLDCYPRISQWRRFTAVCLKTDGSGRSISPAAGGHIVTLMMRRGGRRVDRTA